MIKNIVIGEEVTITTPNKVGILAEVAMLLANKGVNINAILGYEAGMMGKVFLITDANLVIIDELKKKKYKMVRETEVLLVDLENKPGAFKIVATEMKENKIDIKYAYITPCTCATKGSSRMVLQTSDNEKAMALLNKYISS